MSDWPVVPHPSDPGGLAPGAAREVNMILPISVPGRHQVKIHLAMPEADARSLVNMSDELAYEMGPVFELIRSSLRNFIAEEG